MTQAAANPDPPEPVIRPFAAVLQEIDSGRAHAILSDLLHELTQAVKDTGKKGDLTIKVTVEPIKAGNTTNLVATVVPTLKAPTDSKKSSVFFTDKSGNLTREDPNQPVLPFRVAGDERKAANQ